MRRHHAPPPDHAHRSPGTPTRQLPPTPATAWYTTVVQPTPREAGRIRSEVRRLLADDGLPPAAVADIVLVISELVSNLIRHGGRTPGTLRLTRAGQRLRIEASDTTQSPPCRRHPTPDDEDGRGLTLIAALTTQHGWIIHPDGKTVVCETHLPAPTPTHARLRP